MSSGRMLSAVCTEPGLAESGGDLLPRWSGRADGGRQCDHVGKAGLGLARGMQSALR